MSLVTNVQLRKNAPKLIAVAIAVSIVIYVLFEILEDVFIEGTPLDIFANQSSDSNPRTSVWEVVKDPHPAQTVSIRRTIHDDTLLGGLRLEWWSPRGPTPNIYVFIDRELAIAVCELLNANNTKQEPPS